MEILGNYTKNRYLLREEVRKDKAYKVTELAPQQMNRTTILEQVDSDKEIKMGVITDKKTNKDIIQLPNISSIIAISTSDLLVICENEDENYDFYHYEISLKGAEKIISMEKLTNISSRDDHKIWLFSSPRAGQMIYNAKAKRVFNVNGLLPNATMASFQIYNDENQDFDFIKMSFNYSKGKAEDIITASIDPDSFEIMETYSVNRPNHILYEGETKESENKRYHMVSKDFIPFIEENYGKALTLINMQMELIEKLPVEDIKAMMAYNQTAYKLVLEQKKAE